MNIYDTNPVVCKKYSLPIGEIGFDVAVIMTSCGMCVSQLSEANNVIRTVGISEQSFHANVVENRKRGEIINEMF
jgi:hypothetical protein